MLRHYLTGRVGTLLVMLLLSTVSWIYITAAESRVDTFPGRLPITVKNVSSGFVAVPETESIEVRLAADQRSWSLLSADSFTAQVDLKGLGVGIHELPVTVAVAIPNVQVVEKIPSSIKVRLEEQIAKEVPVRVVVQGKAAPGKAPGEAVATPRKVLVTGPKSVVTAVNDVQALVTLGGEGSDVARTVKLQVQGKNGEAVENLRFEPETVGVSIPIVQASNARTLGVRVITTGSPKEGFYVQKVVVTPPTVTITGDESAEAIDTAPIDLANLSATKTIAVELALPSGATVVEGSLRASVTLTVAAVPVAKQVPVTFAFQGLDPALKVASIDPAVGSAVIVGGGDVVAGVNAVTATISVAGKGEGIHAIALTTDLVQVPAGVTSGSLTPSAVSVTLSKK